MYQRLISDSKMNFISQLRLFCCVLLLISLNLVQAQSSKTYDKKRNYNVKNVDLSYKPDRKSELSLDISQYGNEYYKIAYQPDVKKEVEEYGEQSQGQGVDFKYKPLDKATYGYEYDPENKHKIKVDLEQYQESPQWKPPAELYFKPYDGNSPNQYEQQKFDLAFEPSKTYEVDLDQSQYQKYYKTY